jgi:hypothetical protein
LSAVESNATTSGWDETTGLRESLSPPAPFAPVARLISHVFPSCVSRTKTSTTASLSPLLRLVALDSNATYLPSAEIAGLPESPLAPAPVAPVARLTSDVVPFTVSRTNTFWTELSSSALRSSALDSNAT